MMDEKLSTLSEHLSCRTGLSTASWPLVANILPPGANRQRPTERFSLLPERAECRLPVSGLIASSTPVFAGRHRPYLHLFEETLQDMVRGVAPLLERCLDPYRQFQSFEALLHAGGLSRLTPTLFT